MASRSSTVGTGGVPIMQADQQQAGKLDFDDPQTWKRKIDVGLKARKTHSSESRWDDIEGYWNHAFPEGDPVFNLIYMFGRALIPSLMFQSPVISNIPRNAEAIPFASMWDSVDNWLVQEMELEGVMKDAILSAYLYNMAPIETGFDFPDSKNEQIQQIGELGLLSGGETPDRARRTNFPWFDVVPVRNFVFDPLAKNVRKMSWYAKLLWLPTRVLLEDDTLIKDNVQATHMPTEMTNPETQDIFTEEASLEGYTAVWEVHDAITRRWHWQTVDGKFLFEPADDPLQID